MGRPEVRSQTAFIVTREFGSTLRRPDITGSYCESSLPESRSLCRPQDCTTL